MAAGSREISDFGFRIADLKKQAEKHQGLGTSRRRGETEIVRIEEFRDLRY